MKFVLTAILICLSLFFVPIVNAKTVIQMGEQGYNPSDISINKGEVVVFENVSKNARWPASNIHPTHEIYPEFDPKKPIEPNESWSFKFDKPGAWRMHDHLYPGITGTITVIGEPEGHVDKPIPSLFEKLKDYILSIYYKINPKALEKKFSRISLETFEPGDPEIKEAIKVLGIDKIRDKLVLDSGSGSKYDCHQQAHKLGRMSYEISGMKAFQTMDTTCHSGLIHGAMEAFLKEKGTTNLASEIKKLCDSATTDFGHFECLHGVGHGVLAYLDYDLPKALENCKTLSDSFSQSSCFGGAIMENIIVSEGNGAVPAHTTKWVSDDPYFPCNGIDQSLDVQVQCYMMQTARMLDMNKYDFTKVAPLCNGVPKDMKSTCFQSLGRDAAGQTLRDPVRTNSLCHLAPKLYYSDCIRGALYVFIEFWGANLTNQPHGLCKVLDDPDKPYCYQLLGERLPGIFGKSTKKQIKQIKQICSYSEARFQMDCENAAGVSNFN